MTLTPPHRVKPTYVPDGYKLATKTFDDVAGGFPGSTPQVAFTFMKDGDFVYPLVVYAAMSNGDERSLIATELRSGVPVDLDRPGVSATYHDGLWQLGPGSDQRGSPQHPVHWDSREVHSITATDGEVVLAARGSRHRGVGIDELVKMLQSLI